MNRKKSYNIRTLESQRTMMMNKIMRDPPSVIFCPLAVESWGLFAAASCFSSLIPSPFLPLSFPTFPSLLPLTPLPEAPHTSHRQWMLTHCSLDTTVAAFFQRCKARNICSMRTCCHLVVLKDVSWVVVFFPKKRQTCL